MWVIRSPSVTTSRDLAGRHIQTKPMLPSINAGSAPHDR
jgi:hypothetical protein